MDEMSIFNSARERAEPAERAAYLDATCGRDTAMRRNIEQLLSAYARAGSFLEDAVARATDQPTPGGDTAPTLVGEALDLTQASPPGARMRRFGDYEILDEIARGGMGVVFRARQRSLDRIVAVKMILVGKLAGDIEVRRFRREAEAAAKLDHPGIVPVFEVGTCDDQPFFSMAYVDGYSLADPRAQVPRPPREAAQWMLQVANAVEHAHALGFVHRDLKPGNILFEPRTGALKVTDFGLARCVRDERSLTVSGQILGTPGYMAPEQASGVAEPVGPAVDIHALGAVLYFLLTGRPPYQADNPVDTLLSTTKTDPVPPRSLNPSVPRDLDTICLKCLNKEPSRRYRSATDFAADLANWLDGRPIHARPVSFVERSWRWSRRNPLLATLGSLSLVSVLLLAMVSTIAYVRTAGALAESDQRFYSNQLMLASRELDARHRNQALWLLKATDPQRRGWEWNYLARRCTPQQIVLPAGTLPFGHTGQGRNAASGRNTAPGRNTEGTEGTDFTGGSESTEWLDVSADGRVALRVDPQDASRVWLVDVATGAIQHEWLLPVANRVSLTLRASADGIVVAWAVGLTLRWETWDVTHDERTQVHERSTTCFVGVDASRQWIAGDVVDGDQVRRVIWDVDSGSERMGIDPNSPPFWGEQCVLQQPHAKRLVLCDAAGEHAADLNQAIEVFGMRESTVRERIVTLGLVKPAIPRGDPVQSVVHVWRRDSEKLGELVLEHTFGFDGGLSDAVISRDGRWLAAAVSPLLGMGQVLVWDVESGELVRTLRPSGASEFRTVASFHELQFDSAGRDLALRVSTRDGRFLWVVWPEFLGPPAQRSELPISDADAVEVSADVRQAVVRSARDGKLHDVTLKRDEGKRDEGKRGELHREILRRQPIRFRHETPAKPYELVAANGVRAVYEQPTVMPMMGPVNDGKFELRGPQSELLASLTGKVGLVTTMAFNRDGTRLVTIAADETTRGRASLLGIGVDWDSDEFNQSAEIKLWSVPAGRLLWTARGHAGDVTDVAFSSDGRRLATSSTPRFGAVYPAGEHGEVLIWDAETGQSLLQLTGPSDGFTAVTFSQSGDWLAAAAGRQLWVWDGRPVALESALPAKSKAARKSSGNSTSRSGATSSAGSVAPGASAKAASRRTWPVESKYVMLHANECTAENLAALRNLPHLEHLMIVPSTDPFGPPPVEGPNFPIDLPPIKQLTLVGFHKLNSACLPRIARCETLERLTAESFGADIDFSELSRSAGLRQLKLKGQFGDDAVLGLASSRTLRSVELTAPVRGEFLRDWTELAQLESLSLRSPVFVSSSLAALLQFPLLKQLEFEVPTLDATDLRVLEQLPALESLTIRDLREAAPLWPTIMRLSNLRTLTLHAHYGGQVTMTRDQLRRLPHALKQLNLGISVVDDDGERLPTLVVLRDVLAGRPELDIQYLGRRWITPVVSHHKYP